jgi:dephospho-CoA kinase
MVILGLTGSIGMGKTTTAADFRRRGVPVHDSDQVVHRLLARKGAAVPMVGAVFPEAVKEGAIDRRLLGSMVFGDAAALARLEAILHPMVHADQKRFLKLAAARRCALVVLDVPLLLETGGDARCDAVVVATAPAFVQAERVLRRPGMTARRFQAILTSQMPDAEKRRRADFVVRTGLGRDFARRSVAHIIQRARRLVGRQWPPPGRMPGFRA